MGDQKGEASPIRKVAVLGAGVMGAQIAAHLVNADVAALLFDLASEDKDPSALIRKSIKNLATLQPAPLAVSERTTLITPANYDTDLELLRDCDLVIEAISERPDWKADLYGKVVPYLRDDAVFATNTSGLSVNALSKNLPDGLRARFCGVHFFNPPRYMKLVELIPTQDTQATVLDGLETFLVTTLGKGVVRAKDTPNFIGNRIGVFSMLAAIHHAERLGILFDQVDALTGTVIGRPKSATFRTADVVGLDTMAHVVEGSAQVLGDDPWKEYYTLPSWLKGLIEKGALGQKTKAGIYRKDGKTILVLDPETGDYRPSQSKLDPQITEFLGNKDIGARFTALRGSDHPHAEFLWAIHRDVFHYAAVLLDDIADNARDVDLALRWGFGWRLGPFETWQAAGWRQVATWMDQDIQAGKAMANLPLPTWAQEIDAAHTAQGSWAPGSQSFHGRSDLPVYQRQLFPEIILGYGKPSEGETAYQNDGVRLWHQDDGIAILSFLSKMHVFGEEVLDGVQEAIKIAEQGFSGLVVWQPEEPFSAGADLAQFMPVLKSGDGDAIDQLVHKFQRTILRLRYSQIPVVGAPRGLALGGGCEFLMHCDRVVAALETYMGLVEVGVGLIPAGGGSKELALRAATYAPDSDPFPFLRNYFETVAKGEVAKSAEQAKQYGFLRESDVIVFNADELLYVAKAQAKALAESGYRPPLPHRFPVAGRTGIANMRSVLVNMHTGGFISDHDNLVATHVAEVLCGGEIEPGAEVDEQWMLRLERKAFVELAQTELTQARIEHMLKTGKPLRN